MKGKWLLGTGLTLTLALTAVAGLACGGSKSSTDSSTAAPAPAVSANLILDLDTVRGPGGILPEQRPAKSCVQANKIPVGGQVVWRIRVIDPLTGKEMDDKSLDSVTIKLSDGQTFTAKYGGHPAAAPVDNFWATSWNVPANYPTGAVDYTVTAKDKEGRTGQWNQMKVASAMLQIVATDPLARSNGQPGELVVAAR